MIECKECCALETQDSLRFDENGVCSVCNQIKAKRTAIDWDRRKKMLIELCDRYRGKHPYDCIVPFSGGKDSTYTLWYLVKKLNMKPLVVSYDHGFYRPRHLANRERTLKKLDCDFILFKTSWKVVRELMLESLRRRGDFCWHCHCGIYAGSMQMAVKYKIPLIFWGQPNSEYDSYGYSFEEIEEVNEKMFNRYINLGISANDMVGMLPDSISLRDLGLFQFPSFEELKANKTVSVRLGSFIPWDIPLIGETIQNELGWKYSRVEGVPPEYGWEKVECMFQGIRDYLKFIKRGSARTRHLTSIDIREGNMDRATAVKLIEKYDGKRPASLDLFCELIGITEKEFMEIALSHVVAPHVHDPEKTQNADPLDDMGSWRDLLGIS